MNEQDFYNKIDSRFIKIDDVEFSVKTIGKGKDIVFIHGFFVSGYTWRKIIPELSQNFTCHIIDMPGFGKTKWGKQTNLGFRAQSKRLGKLLSKMNLDNLSIISQDTGASITRQVAIDNPSLVENLILINTEIPNHRPPFIPMHQFLAKLPLSNFVFRNLLKVGFIVRSPLLINQFYSDKKLLKDPEYISKYVNDLKSYQSMEGFLRYLIGIEWDVVDDFKENHKKIQANVMMVWGEDDKTFPTQLAENMCEQFDKKVIFNRISNASLMPHEEQPNEVISLVKSFIEN
jgi:pimeloyl-ACP methyl ester carboxylesterase